MVHEPPEFLASKAVADADPSRAHLFGLHKPTERPSCGLRGPSVLIKPQVPDRLLGRQDGRNGLRRARFGEVLNHAVFPWV